LAKREAADAAAAANKKGGNKAKKGGSQGSKGGEAVVGSDPVV